MASSESEDYDTNSGGLEIQPNKEKILETHPSSEMSRKKTQSKKPQFAKANPESLSDCSTPLKNPVLKGSPANKLVSYSADSIEDKVENPEASRNYVPSPPASFRFEGTKFLSSPNLSDLNLILDQVQSSDILVSARNNISDIFKVLKWAYQEINELNQRNRDFYNKSEELELKLAALSYEEGKLNKSSVGKKGGDTEEKYKSMEEEMVKIKNNLKIVVEQNHKMARHNAIIINAMFEKMEKTQQSLLVVDLEENKEIKNEDQGISKRTWANLKRKVPPTTQMVQILKRGV